MALPPTPSRLRRSPRPLPMLSSTSLLRYRQSNVAPSSRLSSTTIAVVSEP